MLKYVLGVLVCIAVIIPILGHKPLVTATAYSPISAEYPSSPYIFIKTAIGEVNASLPSILHCNTADLNNDGIPELLVCDHNNKSVIAYFKIKQEWNSKVLANNLLGPCHTHCSDLDNDGDNDIAVAVLGDLFPNDTEVGSVVILEQTASGFQQHRVLEHVRRVTDVQSTDLDGDGDQDLVVAVFGHAHGEVLWLECTGTFTYKKHRLHQAPGAIHVPLADYDADGDIDIAVCISQHDEEVLLLEQQAGMQFVKHQIFKSINYDLGISGLVQTDIDADGDQDLLLSCGDNLENTFHNPQSYHGVYLLENKGSLKFSNKRISNLPGCYGVAVGDIDDDGDKDIALVSMVNNWENRNCSSLVWLEQEQPLSFKSWHVSNDPIQLVSTVVADFDSDGRVEIVAGGLHLFPPYERIGRLHQWVVDP